MQEEIYADQNEGRNFFLLPSAHSSQSPTHTPSCTSCTQDASMAEPRPHPLSLFWHTGSIYGSAPPTPPLVFLAHRKHLWQCPTPTSSRTFCTQEAHGVKQQCLGQVPVVKPLCGTWQSGHLACKKSCLVECWRIHS
jgi:hypothetical protein